MEAVAKSLEAATPIRVDHCTIDLERVGGIK